MIERLFPARLGTGFRWLVASSWAANLGDGFSVAAGPLLVAAHTRDASLVALALLLQRLPWLLFGLVGGVVADRLDRARLIAAVECTRVAVGGGARPRDRHPPGGHRGGARRALPARHRGGVQPDRLRLDAALARRGDDLILGNSRLLPGVVTLNQLAGPALGALLFAGRMEWPFVGQAAFVVAGAVMIMRISLPPRARGAGHTHLRAEVVEGCRWTFRHPGVRTLVLTIFIFNITFAAAWSVLVLVLYAQERLRLGAVGFGLLTTAKRVRPRGLWRAGARSSRGRVDREPLRRDRPLLVRLRRIGRVRGPHVAPAQPHRPRGAEGARGLTGVAGGRLLAAPPADCGRLSVLVGHQGRSARPEPEIPGAPAPRRPPRASATTARCAPPRRAPLPPRPGPWRAPSARPRTRASGPSGRRGRRPLRR
jgi:hypothetical protein